MSTLEIQTGPIPAIQSTPEQEQLAQEKLARARAARRAKAKIEPESPAVALAQIGELPDMGTLDLEDEPEPQASSAMETSWPTGPNGQPVSPKYARMLKEREQEREALESIPDAPPVEEADLEAHEAAKSAWMSAQTLLHALQAESAGLQGRMEDAVQAGLFDQLQALRARRAELPAELDAARVGHAKAEIRYRVLGIPILRAKEQALAVEAHKERQALLELEKAHHVAQADYEAAKEDRREASLLASHAQQNLDALYVELASEQIAPQRHRVPSSVQQSGADLSGLMAQNGGHRG